MKPGLIIALLIAGREIVLSGGTSGVSPLQDSERAIVFAVRQEIHASRLEKRSDVCVGFDTRMAINEKAILSELRRSGLKIHNIGWCIRGPRGLAIFVGKQGNESAPGFFELPVDLSDWWPIQREGADLGTLLRKGIYTIKCSEGSEPELVSYSQTCCSEAEKNKGVVKAPSIFKQ